MGVSADSTPDVGAKYGSVSLECTLCRISQGAITCGGEVVGILFQRWVALWSDNKATFVTASMEDIGILHAIRQLDQIGRASFDRVLLLRSASNYTLPPPDVTVADSLGEEGVAYPGLQCALENGFKVGHAVIQEIITHWARYRESTPER